MAFALALAGGVMITVSFVELWLPEFWQKGRWAEGGLGAGLGVLAFLALKMLVPEPQLAPDVVVKSDSDNDACEEGISQVNREAISRQQHQAKQWQLGLLLTVALTAH